jgi:predicted MFS family arabinose efflux permease
LYPIWGYLYDRYARAKLLSLASFIWGATTWLNALARSFGVFVVTRASTGIDDSSYPGLFTFIADYFRTNLRGKVYGLLQLAQPIGYLVGMILALMVAPMIGGWRSRLLHHRLAGTCACRLHLLRSEGHAARQSRTRVRADGGDADLQILVGGGETDLQKAHHVVHLCPGFRGRLPVECHHLFLLRLPRT